MTRLTKKLYWKFYRPYKVIKHIGKIAYPLNLFALMKIHNVFHVLLFKLCNPEKNSKQFSPLPLIKIDGKKKFEVKKILNSRNHYGKLQYLIKWLGYLNTDNQ